MIDTPDLHEGLCFPDRTSAIVAISIWAIGNRIELLRQQQDCDSIHWICNCHQNRSYRRGHALEITISANCDSTWFISRYDPGAEHDRCPDPPAQREHIDVVTWRHMSTQNGAALVSAVRHTIGTTVSVGKIRRSVQKVYEATGLSPDAQWRCIPDLMRRLSGLGIDATYETTGTHTPLQIIRWFVASPYARKWCTSSSFVGVVFIDGCHLSDETRGTLLVLCTVSPNHDIVPLAFQWCQGETRANYEALLAGCAAWLPPDVTFMSDEAEAIQSAISTIYPASEHGLCAFHIAKKLGPARKEFWKLLESETATIFAHNWSHFQTYHPDIAARISPKLSKVVRHLGAPYRFGYNADSPIESVNASLVDIRSDNPCDLILGILEYCSNQMSRISEALNHPVNLSLDCVPWANNVINRRTRPIGLADVVLQDHSAFHVPTIGNYGQRVTYQVTTKSCTCGSIETEGLPCRHIWLVLDKLNRSGEWYDLIQPVYSCVAMRDTVAKCMVKIDLPRILDLDVSGNVAMPSYKRPSGRPRDGRHRAPDEGAAPPKRKMRCTKCGEIGHNKRGCRK